MEKFVPLTSYAQNFEDVMLWRALKHVQNGCYVDVGAQHPVIDSVSKLFYEHGWRGVHIEPVPEYAELLRQDRPDETVLQIALSDLEGTLELSVIPDTGLSTAVAAYAQRYQTEQGFDCQQLQVPVLTLNSALKSLVGKDIHWLKIDVEGFEEKVLKGWDSQTLRPWVMVVEATIPSLRETNFASWDPILTAADYQFVYFDGLNRFYLAIEHSELAEAFSIPPNVFDAVQLSGLASSELCQGLILAHQARERELTTQAEIRAEHEKWLEAHSQRLQSELDSAVAKVEELSKSSHHWWSAADQINRELQGVYASKSWRITWPLRQAARFGQWVTTLPAQIVRWLLCLLRRLGKLLLVWMMRQILTSQRLKMRALRVLAKHPKLKQYLRQFAMRSGVMGGGHAPLPRSKPSEQRISSGNTVDAEPLTMRTVLPAGLSPRATNIYENLQKAIVMRKN